MNGPIDSKTGWRSFRLRLYLILEAGKKGDHLSQIFDGSMVLLILANVTAFSLATVTEIYDRYGSQLETFNVVSVVIFTVEYFLRIWVSADHKPAAVNGPTKARLRFLISPYMIIDLLAILPFYVALLAPLDLRVLRVFRLIRFLKLARYSPALSSLWGTLVAERRALLGAFIIMMGLLMLCSSLIYFVEGAAQPEVFGSVPQAMWWGLATLTTVGYGDVVPITALGRLIGGVVMILGLGLFALPIGIIATGWSQEIHRREFVVTWGMVARVPFFSRLDAVSVAEIMSLLRSKVVPAGEVIVAKDEIPHSMYFIADGRLEVQLPSGPKYLEEGDFFGAVALIKGLPSPANVTAVTKTHLLSIDAGDFTGLCRRDATLRQHIHDIAQARLAEGWFHSHEEVAPEGPVDAPPLGLTQADIEKAAQDLIRS